MASKYAFCFSENFTNTFPEKKAIPARAQPNSSREGRGPASLSRKVPDPTGLVWHSQITMEVDRITLKTAWKMSLYRASTIPRLP